jgi:hypothetical protein
MRAASQAAQGKARDCEEEDWQGSHTTQALWLSRQFMQRRWEVSSIIFWQKLLQLEATLLYVLCKCMPQ